MDSPNTVTVKVTRRFKASPERVFDAWLDPAKARRFLFATPGGEIVRADLDPRVGGRFLLVDHRNGEDVPHHGEYLVIDRPRRLVFEFTVPKYSGKKSRVSVSFAPADGGCELTLVHEGVLPEYEKPSEDGWGAILSGLSLLVDAK